eukprot:TRINITY_DN8564_c0_g1_i1.p1 TRINITY_DN8564_c0_g1~~TRINITY_DN8564_c0_g1_i1.p1  ORF type:complete len:196 (-),score=35.55 TRINITY_DN8564_c0_g1_i1:65-565(-)
MARWSNVFVVLPGLLLLLVVVSGEDTSASLAALEADDACPAGAEDCALELRQLRHKQQLAEVNQHEEKKLEHRENETNLEVKKHQETKVQQEHNHETELAKQEMHSNATSRDCNQWTGGTCLLSHCDASRGAVECSLGRCMCRQGFCSGQRGVCYFNVMGALGAWR